MTSRSVLYDTLSGGEGYAELAGRYLDEILDTRATPNSRGAICFRCGSRRRYYLHFHALDSDQRHPTHEVNS
jgi:hypothetical protein